MALTFTGQFFDLGLHFLHLFTQGHQRVVVGRRRWRRFSARRRRRFLRLGVGERRKHLHGAIEERQILPDLLIKSYDARGVAERLKLGAHAFLLLREARQRQLKITRQKGLHRVSVKADQLAKELDRKQALALLAFFLENDLSEDRSGDVLIGLSVIDNEIGVLLDHL